MRRGARRSRTRVRGRTIRSTALSISSRVVTNVSRRTQVSLVKRINGVSVSRTTAALSSVLGRHISVAAPEMAGIEFTSLVRKVGAPGITAAIRCGRNIVKAGLVLLRIESTSVVTSLVVNNPKGTGRSTRFKSLRLDTITRTVGRVVNSTSASVTAVVGHGISVLPPVIGL